MISRPRKFSNNSPLGIFASSWLVWAAITLVLSLVFSASCDTMVANLVIFPSILTLITGVSELNKRTKNSRKRQNELVALESLVNVHFVALSRNLERAVRLSDYGTVREDGRREVIEDFLMSLQVDAPQLRSDKMLYKTICHYVEVIDDRQQSTGFDPRNVPADGLAYEWWIAENLRKFGWDAQPTSASGNQGVDVIASKQGLKVGIQCKLYSSSVGNKAVQEVVAGKAFHNLDEAAVMTNSTYTKSASQLAEIHSVKLLTTHDLPYFDAIFLKV